MAKVKKIQTLTEKEERVLQAIRLGGPTKLSFLAPLFPGARPEKGQAYRTADDKRIRQARNAVRRLVRNGLVKRVGRGEYAP